MAETDSQEDRQLEPTERRIQKAREEGQFPQSRDLTTFIVLGLFLAFTLGLGASLMNAFIDMVKSGLTFSDMDYWSDHFFEWLSGPVLKLILWLAALMIPAWLISTLAPLALVKFQPVFAFKFNPSKMNPIKGLQRMFSVQTLSELLKNIAKVVFIFGVGTLYLYSLLDPLNILPRQDLNQGLLNTLHIIETGFMWLFLPIVVIALIDVAIQWFSFKKRMRMSHEELKQELKETEGSPELKARLRQRQRQIATSRMMSALEKADVVLANPDHYSVALRYDASKMLAPIVVAKGVDELALRMQSLAKERSIPVARIPPLARLLHQRLKVGEAIPAPLFEATAKVLAWAYESKQKNTDIQLPDVGPLPTLESLLKRGNDAAVSAQRSAPAVQTR